MMHLDESVVTDGPLYGNIVLQVTDDTDSYIA